MFFKLYKIRRDMSINISITVFDMSTFLGFLVTSYVKIVHCQDFMRFYALH